MSELPAAALLLAASAALVAAWRSGRVRNFALAGLCFGLLALTKAAFFYVFIGLVAFLAALVVIGARKLERKAALARILALALAFAAIVVPWMTRNYVQLGQFQVAERGGVVLYLRALKNEISWEQYQGAFYYWAPVPLQPAIGAALGFGPADLKRGGRLERFHRVPEAEFYREDIAAWHAGRPDDAITFIRKALAEELRLTRLAEETGAERADTIMQREALNMIAANPSRHLATTPLFLWRGAFFAFPVLLAAFLYAAWRRNYPFLVFVVPGLGSLVFFGLVTHFLPRYSVPINPLAVVSLVAFAGIVFSPLWRAQAARLGQKWLTPRTARAYDASGLR
jgi:hypothetical protein